MNRITFVTVLSLLSGCAPIALYSGEKRSLSELSQMIMINSADASISGKFDNLPCPTAKTCTVLPGNHELLIEFIESPQKTNNSEISQIASKGVCKLPFATEPDKKYHLSVIQNSYSMVSPERFSLIIQEGAELREATTVLESKCQVVRK
jgi:hypothetical protein